MNTIAWEVIKYQEPNMANPWYKSILKLNDLVSVPENVGKKVFKRKSDGWSMRITIGDRWLSAIEFFGSYGSEDDQIEIWTSELKKEGDDPFGGLNLEDAKYTCEHWINGDDIDDIGEYLYYREEP